MRILICHLYCNGRKKVVARNCAEGRFDRCGANGARLFQLIHKRKP